MHGLKVYIAKPAEGTTPKGLIVFITDVFGWRFVNNRLLADKYAQNGDFLVLVPDFMNGMPLHLLCQFQLTLSKGNSMDPGVMAMMDQIKAPAGILASVFVKPILAVRLALKFIPWFIQTRPAICHPRVTGFLGALRTNAPPFETKNLKIGAAGYCWGGKHAVLLSHDDPARHVVRHESQTLSKDPMPLIECAFTAHPSMLNVPKDIDAVRLPLSVAVGDTGMALSAVKVKIVKVSREPLLADKLIPWPGDFRSQEAWRP
jgi:dienelactone hydrolase